MFRAHLEDYQELSKVGSVTFGGSKGSISGKGTIRLGNLVFDDVAFMKELGHFNLFSISQICDKKLNVLFTEKECFVVSSDFKMPDENQVLLADLLTKPFDGPRFHYLVVSIGLVLVLLGVEKGDARSTWTWKRKCQLSLANWMQFGFNTDELNAVSTPSAQVNTAEVNTAALNTGETERVQRRKGKDPMTEEDLQAEVQASKKSREQELQELADLEVAQRLKATMDAEAQRQ
ncbi:hypothetical protein Tco_1545070, partial [Tanacetum coccineum]